MIPIVSTVIGAVSGIVKGFFGLKSSQLNTINTALQVLQSMESTDAERAVAIAQIRAAESQSESVLTRNLRPAIVAICTGFWVARMFGYVPPHMGPEEVTFMYTVMGGYIVGWSGSRGIEKVAQIVKGFRIFK